MYNACPGSERPNGSVASIIEETEPPTTILAGDFNLHHSHWAHTRPNLRTSRQADDLVAWAHRNSISMVSKSGEQTHNLGGILDLALGSNSLIRSRGLIARVAKDIVIPSDHKVLRIVLPGGLGPQYGCPGRYLTDSIDKDRLSKAIRPAIPTLKQQLRDLQR